MGVKPSANTVNSCLYDCHVLHHRTSPRNHRFYYRYFTFFLDLDELPVLGKTLKWFGVGPRSFNLFQYRDDDHLYCPKGSGRTAKDAVLTYAEKKGIPREHVASVRLLTHVRVLGYVFNPVSFYFLLDANGEPLAVIPEVGNTFGELKPFFIGKEELQAGGNRFVSRQKKYFYVSPFIDLEASFDFQITLPSERLSIQIDDYQSDRLFLHTSLTGKRLALTDRELLRQFFHFPWVTLKVIGAIHWEALRLYLKGIPYIRKAENPHLQKETYRGRH